MIRYRWPRALDLAQASATMTPETRPLRRFGPWRAYADPAGVVLEQQVVGWTPAGWPADWTESRAIPGAAFQVAEPPPDDLRPWRRRGAAGVETTPVEVLAGYVLEIPPALVGGVAFGPTGQPVGMAGEYAQTLMRLLDAQMSGQETSTADWVRVAYLAIQTAYRLPDDAIAALGLVAAADLAAILEAATAAPKALHDGGPSCAGSPELTPPASPRASSRSPQPLPSGGSEAHHG